MSEKRKHEDESESLSGSDGSRSGKRGKQERDTLKTSFHIRLTGFKVLGEEWISGSVDHGNLLEILKSKFRKGRFSFEKGAGGVPHFQIYVSDYPKRHRRSAVRKFLEEHFDGLVWPKQDYCEPCQNEWATRNYVKKEETHLEGPWEWGLQDESRSLTVDDLPEPYEWQSTILHRYQPEPPLFNSKIDWYVDPEGQIGKTMTLRMLILKEGFMLLDGGAQKMRHLAAKNPAKGYCINLTRSMEERFSYQGLESISDQVYCDTFGSEMKGMIVRKGSWTVVVANCYPDRAKLTESRWNVYVWKDGDFTLEQ